ncbi:hypothetical protein PanWU01x14_137840, partial [Parasponia andersonii]
KGGNLRKRRRNVVAKDHRGSSEFWHRTRSINRVKEEEEEIQENANILRTSKLKDNTNKSRAICLRNVKKIMK